jgi:hypothetical protein
MTRHHGFPLEVHVLGSKLVRHIGRRWGLRTVRLLVLATIPILAFGAGEQLYSFGMAGQLGTGGALVAMNFKEVDRTETESIVEVSGDRPASGVFTGFLLNGMCGLAKDRRERYFQATAIDANPLTFEVVFPSTAPATVSESLSGVAPNVFSVANCPVITYERGKD